MSVRVRYAPSPTGYLHIGNARTALFNYLFARHHGGTMIVRIEDTDLARNVEAGIESQLEYLTWLGVDWDESIDKPGAYGPYQQTQRQELYDDVAKTLQAKGVLYPSYVEKETLEAWLSEGLDRHEIRRRSQMAPFEGAPYALRFAVPEDVVYRLDDVVKGRVEFHSHDIEDWVAIKQNGIPTYNFACAVDDHLMAISHVLRGDDHLTNTPKQLMVFDAMSWPLPQYEHMTLIVNPEGKKLSKRDGSIMQFIEQYDRAGYLPEALFNFIALLGFSPEGEEEIFDKEGFIERFDTKRLSTSPATFDVQKLRYLNHHYLQKLPLETLSALCEPYIKEHQLGRYEDAQWINSLCAVFQERLEYASQITEHYHAFFEHPFRLEEEHLTFLNEENAQPILQAFQAGLEALTLFEPETLKGLIKEVGQATEAKGKRLFMSLRLAVSASMHGPELPKMMHLMGKERVQQRIEETLKHLN